MSGGPIRKRMKRDEIPNGVRFLTFSCERRMPFFSNPAIADVCRDALGAARDRFGCELFAWVVMPEHVHLLIRPKVGVPVARVLRSMKSSVAERVVSRWRELDAPILKRIARPDGSARFWQKGGGFDRNVRDDGEFTREVRYIHLNPVTRGLVERPEQWRWSSVRWWMGDRDRELVCDPPPGDADAWACWKGYV